MRLLARDEVLTLGAAERDIDWEAAWRRELAKDDRRSDRPKGAGPATERAEQCSASAAARCCTLHGALRSGIACAPAWRVWCAWVPTRPALMLPARVC